MTQPATRALLEALAQRLCEAERGGVTTNSAARTAGLNDEDVAVGNTRNDSEHHDGSAIRGEFHRAYRDSFGLDADPDTDLIGRRKDRRRRLETTVGIAVVMLVGVLTLVTALLIVLGGVEVATSTWARMEQRGTPGSRVENQVGADPLSWHTYLSLGATFGVSVLSGIAWRWWRRRRRRTFEDGRSSAPPPT